MELHRSSACDQPMPRNPTGALLQPNTHRSIRHPTLSARAARSDCIQRVVHREQDDPIAFGMPQRLLAHNAAESFTEIGLLQESAKVK